MAWLVDCSTSAAANCLIHHLLHRVVDGLCADPSWDCPSKNLLNDFLPIVLLIPPGVLFVPIWVWSIVPQDVQLCLKALDVAPLAILLVAVLVSIAIVAFLSVPWHSCGFPADCDDPARKDVRV